MPTWEAPSVKKKNFKLNETNFELTFRLRITRIHWLITSNLLICPMPAHPVTTSPPHNESGNTKKENVSKKIIHYFVLIQILSVNNGNPKVFFSFISNLIAFFIEALKSLRSWWLHKYNHVWNGIEPVLQRTKEYSPPALNAIHHQYLAKKHLSLLGLIGDENSRRLSHSTLAT